MDPKLALLSWFLVRGSKPGPALCNVLETQDGSLVDTHKIFGAENFNTPLQERLKYLCEGKENSRMYTGNSLDRGCIQL